MVGYLIEAARKADLIGVFVLTTRSSDWFLKFGFSPATVADLPEERRQSYDSERKSRIYKLELGQSPAAK